MPPEIKKRRVSFNPNWLKDVAYKEWLIPASDGANASCKFCKNNIRYDTQGAKALDEHLMSKKHSENRSLHISPLDTVPSITAFFKKKSKDTDSGATLVVVLVQTMIMIGLHQKVSRKQFLCHHLLVLLQ